MNNEEFQKLVLEQFGKMNTRFDSIDTRLGSMDTRLDSMDTRLDSMDARLDSMDARLGSMDVRLDSLENKVDKIDNSQVRMENELTEKIRALFDAREVQNDINTRIIEALVRIEAKVDVLQLETASIRRVK